MNKDFAKLLAIMVVGGVAKALFQDPRPPAIHNHYNETQPSLAAVPDSPEDNT